jgi:hypothetical protein
MEEMALTEYLCDDLQASDLHPPLARPLAFPLKNTGNELVPTRNRQDWHESVDEL